MAVTHTLQAAFTQSIGSAITIPVGSKTLAFFGTGGDGNNANRVLGGNALINVNSPAFAANFVTVGYNGTVSNSINLNNPRDATRLAAGWTWAAVCRAESGGAQQAPVMNDSAGTGPPTASTLCGFSVQGAASASVFIHSGGTATRATLTMGSVGGGWHFIAETYTGGAAGTWSLAEYTNVPAGSTPATYVASGLAAGNNSPVIGGVVPNWTVGNTVLADVAFVFDCAGVMTTPNIAALAASIRPWLARRGIVC